MRAAPVGFRIQAAYFFELPVEIGEVVVTTVKETPPAELYRILRPCQSLERSGSKRRDFSDTSHT